MDWHANNEPTQAQKLKNNVGPIENNLVGPLLGGSWLVSERQIHGFPTKGHCWQMV